MEGKSPPPPGRPDRFRGIRGFLLPSFSKVQGSRSFPFSALRERAIFFPLFSKNYRVGTLSWMRCVLLGLPFAVGCPLFCK